MPTRAATSSAPPSPAPCGSWTINDVLGLAASVKVHQKSGSIEFRLPGGLSAMAENTCQSLLAGLMLYFTELHDEYPDNIEVMEG